MAGPEDFEPLFKMNRLGPLRAPTLPLPVKFRPVFKDLDLHDQVAEHKVHETDSFDISDRKSKNDLSVRKIFFKDPLCPPDIMFTEGKESAADCESSANKLGRNMRASHGPFGMQNHKQVRDIMNERRRLLEQQKEEQRKYNQEINSKHAAAKLVTSLLQNGFQIIPPHSTPRVHQPSATPTAVALSSTLADECEQIGPVEENKLIVAMHKELRRISDARS